MNCPWKEDELDSKLPASIKKYIAENDINFYVIDAVSIAREIGLGGRINMIMQSAFFKLANVIPVDEAVKYLKESVEKTYGRKGQNIVDMNKAAIDRGVEALHKVNVPAAWKDATEEPMPIKDEPEFVKNIQRPMARNEEMNYLLVLSSVWKMELSPLELQPTKSVV